jgi:LysR family transcriptional regulator, nitrogen assimilation regulatory protein
MNVLQLRYFMQVVGDRSFTKAARTLNVAQPAVSRQVRLLEGELGVELLVRHAGGADATEAGSLLYFKAQSLLALIGEIRNEVGAKSKEPSGTIRIGFVPSIGNFLIPPLVESYRARFPKVAIQLFEGFSNVLSGWLLSDRIDVAILSEHNRNPLLIYQQLYEEDLWLFHNFRSERSKRKYTLEDVVGKPLVQTSADTGLRRILNKSPLPAGAALNIVVEVESLLVLKHLVRNGVGYHVSPYTSFFDSIREKALYGGPIHGISILRSIALAKGRPISRATSELIALTRSEIARLQSITGDHIRPRG